MSSSAWDKWGTKPSNGTTNFWKNSPLSQTSTVASDDELTPTSSTSSPWGKLQQAWGSAQSFTKKYAALPTDQEAVVLEDGNIAAVSEKETPRTWLSWKTQDPEVAAASTSSMPWDVRFKYFVTFVIMGLVFFGMASIFIPLIVIRPSKFALSFTFGSLCLMGAFAMLRGPMIYLRGLVQTSRLPLTLAYFLSLGSTLYSCLILGNYILVVVSSVLQLVTLSAFALGALPGGNASLKAFGMMFWRATRNMVNMMSRLFAG